LEIYSDGTSETSADEQLEKAQIEGFVGVNDEDDDILDTCQATERLVKCSLKEIGGGVVDSREVQAVSGGVYRGYCGFLDLLIRIQSHPTRHRDSDGGCTLGGETGRDEESF